MQASRKRHNDSGETVPISTEKEVDCSSQRAAKQMSLASKLRTQLNEAALPDLEDWAPPHWDEVLENVWAMRAARDAPVDRMGAESFLTDPLVEDPKVSRLHVLVSLMLSSQTRDEVNHAAMCRLKAAGLSLAWLRSVPQQQLADMLRPVGFWRRKAQYLKAAAELLETDFGGDIPTSVGDLCKLPGVGPKMAHLTMNIAWRDVSGIGVDTHVHRISNRLGWVRRPTKTPEETRLALQTWLPKQHWAEINLLLVGLGQQICTPVAPRCGECRNFNLCPAATSGSPAKKTRR